MTETQCRRLELFAANVQEMKSSFVWQNTMLKHVAALLYAAEDKVIDADAIRQSYDLIKDNTGVFSMFRGNSALNIATMLSLAGDMEKRMCDTLQVYDALKEERFHASDYLVVAAYQIAAGSSAEGFQTAVSRMRAFYDGMKDQHPFLTSSDDYIFAAMLGLSDVDVAVGAERMEQLYRALKTEFFSGNGVQALTEVLILGDQTADVLDRVLSLKQLLRNFGLKMENQDTLSSLGILALLPGTVDDIVRDVADTFEYLRTQKGFGAWSFSKQELELYASALTAYEHVASVKSGILTTTIATSITNIILAQQAAMAAMVASSTAAASAGT